MQILRSLSRGFVGLGISVARQALPLRLQWKCDEGREIGGIGRSPPIAGIIRVWVVRRS